MSSSQAPAASKRTAKATAPTGGTAVQDAIEDVTDLSALTSSLGGLADDKEAYDYLKQYLLEMGGDDGQFKDIDAAVVPLSSGTTWHPRIAH